ncbi:MAG: Asp23/Gls24 family envelope stress response protein [Clostridia bacterium]
MDQTTQNTQEEGFGKLFVAEDTVAFIAMMEAMSVLGVHEVSAGVTDELYEMIRNKHARGIRVEVGNKETIINIPICVIYGYDIRQVARNIQSRIAKAVEEATELLVKEINVTVNDIKFGEKHDLQDEETMSLEQFPGCCGTILITEYVVAWIAKTQALAVNGVAELSSGIAGEIAGLISKRNEARGVKVEAGQKEVLIDLYLVVQYGCRVPDVAWETQEKVKSTVEKLTGFVVKEVNVTVQGIDFENDFVPQK